LTDRPDVTAAELDFALIRGEVQRDYAHRGLPLVDVGRSVDSSCGDLVAHRAIRRDGVLMWRVSRRACADSLLIEAPDAEAAFLVARQAGGPAAERTPEPASRSNSGPAPETVAEPSALPARPARLSVTVAALGLTVLIALAAALPSQAQAARKLALVIGNDAYDNVAPLERAVGDARAYRDMLRDDRGFDVTFLKDADRLAMVRGISQFISEVREGDTVMLAYSGHGVQLDPDRRDTLYLLPTDIPALNPGEGGLEFYLDAAAINFARISRELEARGAALRVFILDACRDNPFGSVAGGRSVGLSRGLGRINESKGEFVFFSAAPGEVALDRLPEGDEDPNSVFTRVFLRHFTKGSYLEDVANDVQEEVLTLSRQASISQQPYYSDGVAGKACLDGDCGAKPLASAPSPQENLEPTYWRLCEQKKTGAFCQAYLDQFPTGPRAPLAKLLLAEAQASAGAPTPPVRGEPSSPAQSAEPALAQAEANSAEQKTDRGGARPSAVVEDGRNQPVAALAPAEESQPTYTPAMAAAAWRKLRKTWNASRVASFLSTYPGAKENGEARQRLAYLTDQQKTAQRHLNRLGYDAGPVDGVWGRRSATALRQFERAAGLSATGALTSSLVESLRKAPTPVARDADLPDPPKATQQPAPTPVARAADLPSPPKAAQQTAPTPAPKAAAIDRGVWTAIGRTRRGSVVHVRIETTGATAVAKVVLQFGSRPPWWASGQPLVRTSCPIGPNLSAISCKLKGGNGEMSLSGALSRLRFDGGDHIGDAWVTMARKS
jgi:peptidoglycan hydrolase-like protein with peptidoglycan-binding domain